MYFEELLHNTNDVLTLVTISLDYTREMQVARFSWGWLIKTEAVDDTGGTVIETLVSRDGRFATMLHRESLTRDGCDRATHYDARNDEYPVGSVVRLSREANYA